MIEMGRQRAACISREKEGARRRPGYGAPRIVMKWLNHEVVTGVIVYTATNDVLCSIYAMAGAVIPDKLEGNPGTGSAYWRWRSRHRGWSHWPMIYIAVGGTLHEYMAAGGEALWQTPAVIGFYLMAGALLHIAEDAVCGEVPLLRPDRKAGLKLFKVGSVAEYLFALAVVLLCYCLHAGLGGG